MKRNSAKQTVTDAFDIVRTVGLTLPHVEATTKYDGSPVLKVDGIFMAGLATHPSAEPDTLVVRAGLEDRERLMEDAPETCYRLMADARRKKFSVVLVAAFDRIARSTRNFLQIIDELDSLGIEFISRREGVATGGPMGRLFVTIISAIAELERSLVWQCTVGTMRPWSSRGYSITAD
jgi:hypothetical protein